MKEFLLYPAGSTQACRYAAEMLQRNGFSPVDHPTPEVTHLLLDVPSFDSNGALRGGRDAGELLSMLPEDICIVGGKLDQPVLRGHSTLDLLQKEDYLAANAAITAHCALKVAAPYLQTTFADTPTLILGWGRIGKCLAQLLKRLHCPVTVATRKETDRNILRALGYSVLSPEECGGHLKEMRLLFNTIPTPVLSRESLAAARHCVQIELASQPGLSGPHVIPALGLPGVYAPESSGHLIAQMFITHFLEVEP